MPTYTCGERLQRGGLAAFFFTLPGTLLSALGWIGFLVGFGWLNEQTIQFEINGGHAGRGFLAEYYLLAISPPIYFILFSIYMLTGLWAVGILSQIAATLVMLVAGGIAYSVGIFVAILFETPRVQHTSELSDPEIYTIVMFAGAVLTCIGMVYSMAMIPVIGTFQHKRIYNNSYFAGDNNRQKVHLKSTMFTLTGTLLNVMGWITFVVGFGWLNEQIYRSQTSTLYDSHAGRWTLAGFYILAVSPPFYFFIYSIYMMTGQWAIGMLSQFGAVVVTMAAGGMTYSIGIDVTQAAEFLSNNRSIQLGDTGIFHIVAFAGAVVVSIGMALSNALVPVMSSVYHNKPSETRGEGPQRPGNHEMSKRSPYSY